MNISKKWASLYQKTNQLTQPESIDNLLSTDELGAIEQAIIRALNVFLDKGELHLGIKIYVDKVLQPSFIAKMTENRPEENETLELWGKKIFGNKKFGVVFNSLESFDNTIGELMCPIVAPLLEKAGIPLGGLSFLFFTGNYGFTPFGIHKETKGEEGFLFHIGPNKKEFHAWDTKELNEIPHNEKVFHEVEKMLPVSKKYVLHPGSVMFVPHQVYHIANTKEFSLSLVMDYINPSETHLERELAKDIAARETIVTKDKKYLEPVKGEYKKEDSNAYLNSASIFEQFETALNKKVLRLKSNGGILLPSIKSFQKYFPNGKFEISGKSVFPIFSIERDKQKSLLLARGNEISVTSNKNLTLVLSKLNQGESLTLKNLQDYLSPEWDVVAIYGFVSDLLQLEAINVTDLS